MLTRWYTPWRSGVMWTVYGVLVKVVKKKGRGGCLKSFDGIMASPQVWQQMRGSSWKSSIGLKQKSVMFINQKKKKRESFSFFHSMLKKPGSSNGKINSEIKQKTIDLTSWVVYHMPQWTFHSVLSFINYPLLIKPVKDHFTNFWVTSV